MDQESELVAVDHTMRSYYAAVSLGYAAAAARHFTVPAMFMTQKGVWSPATIADIETSYVAMLRDYGARGYSHSTVMIARRAVVWLRMTLPRGVHRRQPLSPDRQVRPELPRFHPSISAPTVRLP